MLRAVLLLLISGCGARGADDAGTPCAQHFDREDGGLFLTLSLCPVTTPIYYDVARTFRLETSDGGALPFGDECSACSRCPSLAVCDALGTASVEVGRQARLLRVFDGRVPTGRATCGTTGDTCEVRSPLPAGEYRVRFCISRSAEGDAQAPRLGPEECKVVGFRLPLDKGVSASFE